MPSAGVAVAPNASLKLVGPDGPVSAAGLSLNNTKGLGPYDAGTG